MGEQSESRAVEWWPLRRVLSEFRPGSQDEPWSWEDERADLMERDVSAMHDLMDSIHHYGQQRPIVLGNDGRVWDGHHRVVACMVMGGVHIAVTKALPQWRSLAKDGARRAEVRSICEVGVLDKIMSWGEWETLLYAAEEASASGRPQGSTDG